MPQLLSKAHADIVILSEWDTRLFSTLTQRTTVVEVAAAEFAVSNNKPIVWIWVMEHMWIGNGHGMIRKYGLDMCRQCFRERSAQIGFIKVKNVFEMAKYSVN